MYVSLRQGESFEQLLKRFRAGVAKDGIISEYKRHQSFMSRSQKTRAKIQRAQRKQKAKMARRVAAA
ncbi:MAG: 30S ribosomal protein S21 [Chloroflexi bacterium]|nr:30S ribosomal protein S21 [Chloroflexota bacterium]